MRRILRLFVAALALSFALPLATARADVTVKLGTLAPDGSAWHNLLKQMGEEWLKISGGKVKLKIYAGGVVGNEGDTVRKLQIGQLNAAAISVVGLHDLETSSQCLGTPGMIEDQAEYDAVMEKMIPSLDKKLLDKGYVVLTWGDTGTVHMFLNKEMKTLADLKGLRMFTWAGDPFAVKSWAAIGFQPVVISSTDILPSLQTKMIEAFATSPIMAFTARWYEGSKTMVTGTFGHLPGATIISKEAWEKIPADIRPQILKVAHEVGDKVNLEVRKMQVESIEQMKKNGIKTWDVPAADRETWNQMAEKVWPVMRGGVCSEAAFDEVKKARDDYRASKGKK